MSHSPVSPFSPSHHFRCDPALSVFASKCQGECHAWTAALCDLGDPGWGDPWFLHWALLLLTPPDLAPGVFCRGSLFCFLWGAIIIMTHKMSSCMNLHCWLRSHFLVFFWLFCFSWFAVFVCFVAVFFVCVFGFLAGIAYWTVYRSITSTFVAIDNWQPCTIISIHLLLRSNVCNNLAEAMKALDGKKSSLLVSPPPLVVFWCFLVQSVFCWSFPPDIWLHLQRSGCHTFGMACRGWLAPVFTPLSWQQRRRPCVGLCPLHHVVGVVHVPLAPALRYSPSGDPESP